MSWANPKTRALLYGSVLVALGAVVYRPSLDIGFWADDYTFYEVASRLSFPEYLAFYFDPRLQVQWYRPLQGMMWWVMVSVSGKALTGYHIAQVLLHLANTLLLFAIVARVTRRPRLGFLASVVYATLPAYALAVNWVGVADPLVALFFLASIWFWVGYLRSGARVDFSLAWTAFVAALLSKETAVVLPIALVLLDIGVIRSVGVSRDSRDRLWSRQALTILVKRYVPFLVPLALYAFLEYRAVTQGVFTQSQGYGLGTHIVTALITHLSTLTFPWGLPQPLSYIWLLVVLGLVAIAVRRGATPIVFLLVVAILLLLPVAPLAPNLATASRYLYLPLMVSAVTVAAVLEFGLDRIRRLEWRVAGALALVLLATSSSAAIAEQAVNFGGTARVARLQFRPIIEKRPAVEEDTLLYFIEPPFLSRDIAGLMLQHYGPNVRVYGTDRDRMPNLSSHQRAFVYYRDHEENWQEQRVERLSDVLSRPPLPVRFGPSISLEAFELASAHLHQNEALVLLFYWKGGGNIRVDYTVFTHLITPDGGMVAGYDAPPRQGYYRTTQWYPGVRVVDAAVIPIDSTIRPGEYIVEVGLYDSVTMQRLPVLDSKGNPVSDTFRLEPIYVIE